MKKRACLFLFILVTLTCTRVLAQQLVHKNDSLDVLDSSVRLQLGDYRGNVVWQHSLDKRQWNDLEGSNRNYLDINTDRTGFYRARIQDGTCFVNYSDTVELNYVSTPTYGNDTLRFQIPIHEGYHPDSIRVYIPALKYNKAMAVSWINDDNLNIWNWVHALINRKFVHTGSLQNHYGLDHPQPGFYPKEALEYTDGAGVRHRFAGTLAIFPHLMEDMGLGRDGLAASNNKFCSPRELRILRDFGTTACYHDIKDSAGIGPGDQESYDRALKHASKVATGFLDYTPKIMAEPNGNHSYMVWGKNNPLIQMQTAQNTVVDRFYPFSKQASIDKSDIVVERMFYNGGKFVDEMLERIESEIAGPDSLRSWLIGANHECSADIEGRFFQEVYQRFGAAGTDQVWFPSLDEFYEYQWIRQQAEIKTHVQANVLEVELIVPRQDNFWFNEVSLQLENVAFDTSRTIAISDHCVGASWHWQDSLGHIHVNYNPKTQQRAAKAIRNYLRTASDSDREDAEYFIQLLRPELKARYTTELQQGTMAPVIEDLQYRQKGDTIQQGLITVEVVYQGIATHVQISSDSIADPNRWQSIDEPLQLALEYREGIHPMFVYLKNAFETSSVFKDSLYYKPQALQLHAILIDQGNRITRSENIRVETYFTGTAPTHYRISEDSTFARSNWIPFSGSTLSFALSKPSGMKKVYVQMQAESGLSKIVSDQIEWIEPLSLQGLSIQSGAQVVTNQTVRLTPSFLGLPEWYRASETADLSDVEWRPFSDSIFYTLSEDIGNKTVYLQLQESDGSLSEIAASTLYMSSPDYVGRKMIVVPYEGKEAKIIPMDQGHVINHLPLWQHESFDNTLLLDHTGIAWATRITKPSQLPSEMQKPLTINGYWYPELSENTGVYPDSVINNYFALLENELLPLKKGLRFILPEGMYTLQILLSTRNATTLAKQSSIVYEANGIRVSPQDIPVNNNQVFVCIANVPVQSDGVLDFYVGQTDKAVAGFNLIEIIRENE